MSSTDASDETQQGTQTQEQQQQPQTAAEKTSASILKERRFKLSRYVVNFLSLLLRAAQKSPL
jgi:hypothetical protein